MCKHVRKHVRKHVFSERRMKNTKISTRASGGPRFRVCARETLCSAPHRREQKFPCTRVCRVTFKHSPNPSEIISEVSDYPPCLAKSVIMWGVGRVD